MYLNAERTINMRPCTEYNNYKYGLDHRNKYMNTRTGKQLRERYKSRQVTYLLGTNDVHQDHDIDTSCTAKVQGSYRFERGRIYYEAIPFSPALFG